MKSPASLVQDGVKIASLPTIFHQLTQMVDDPECSFPDVAKLIGGDTSLSARLLRLANSAYMGARVRVETISHAITIIGMAQLRDLVLGTLVTKQFKNISPKLINMESFWKHSIACGVVARIIAIYRKEPNAERFYVMGMLHDLGRLVIYMNLPEESGKLLAENKKRQTLLCQTEREILGFDHAEVGAELLKHWNLPESLQQSTRFHHQPQRENEYAWETALVNVADAIAHALQLGNSGENYVPNLEPKAWNKLDLPAGMMVPIVNQMELQFPDAMQMFLPDK
jgi:HD-like signal output (HDOD) protein